MVGFETKAPSARDITAQGEALGLGEHDGQELKARHIAVATTPGAPSITASSSWAGLLQTPELLDPQHLSCTLDGHPVPSINADLTSGSDTASAHRLRENRGICFMGTTKVGPFDIDAETARKMLSAPLNPNGRPNSDVVRPWVNALDITRRPRDMFIIDFGTDMPEGEAALYELPFEYLKHHVQPIRNENKRATYAANWWIHGEARGDLRRAIECLARYAVTPSLSKHRFFVWKEHEVTPDHQVFAFARDDDYFFGVLHSRPHELWALHMGTQLESRPRYTPNSTFDTFPFPWPPGAEPTEAESPIVRAIAEAARELVRLRDAWLNPPGIPEADLKDKTLTKLYNQRPTWLSNAHRTLDQAVFAAYGWPEDPAALPKQDILARLLALNHGRAAAASEPGKTRVTKKSRSPKAPEPASNPTRTNINPA